MVRRVIGWWWVEGGGGEEGNRMVVGNEGEENRRGGGGGGSGGGGGMFHSRPVHSLMLSAHRFLCLPLRLPPCTVHASDLEIGSLMAIARAPGITGSALGLVDPVSDYQL